MNDNNSSTRPATTPGNTTGFWWRVRLTFGPALAGLLGGGLTIGISYSALVTLLKNVANTYAKYPGVETPWLARDLTLPTLLVIPVVVLGAVGPLGMGLATAWLVRSKDRWGDVSAGMTTALTSSLAAYVVSIGWAVTVATVVVPSIADLTLFGNSTRAPTEATGKPSDVLAERYLDLKETPADDRGAVFFAKIISDQVIGSVNGAWIGVGVSLVTVGLLGFSGTLAGGWLLRRGGPWWSIVVPYGEFTVATSLCAGTLGMAVLGLGRPTTWLGATCLLANTALVVMGVIGRWHWLLRVGVALSWGLVLSGAGLDNRMSQPVTLAAYLAYGVVGVLLFRHWFVPSPRSATATA